jgi:hypothetical protein
VFLILTKYGGKEKYCLNSNEIVFLRQRGNIKAREHMWCEISIRGTEVDVCETFEEICEMLKAKSVDSHVQSDPMADIAAEMLKLRFSIERATPNRY